MINVFTRAIRESDVRPVLRMVRELAAYEKSSHLCHMTFDQLYSALFGESPALFGYVATVESKVVGFALWFLNFSTFEGRHGVYVEDMYVVPEYRRHNVGQELARALAGECAKNGYARLDFCTLNWNIDAISFNASVGAVPMDDWTLYRISGQELAELGLTPSEES